MRSQAAILERIDTMFDPRQWQREVLVSCLTFDNAHPFLTEDATVDEWARQSLDSDDAVVEEMRRYMTYAWEKVEGHQAVEASRSVEKLIAYLFVLGADETLVAMEMRGYAMFGAPRLAFVCQAYDWPIPRGRVRRMIRGDPCRRGCDRGCLVS